MRGFIGAVALASLCLGASAAEAAVKVPPPVGPNQIVFHEIDVDQGVASLLETPCGTIMIDAGGRQAAGSAHLKAYLQAHFAARPALNNRLAALFLTHPHKDHDVFILEVEKTYAVGGYIHNGQKHGSGAWWPNRMLARMQKKGVPHVEVNETLIPFSDKDGYTDAVIDPLTCPGTDPVITVLQDEKLANSEGWTSDVYGQAKFLVMGDLEISAQTLLFSHYHGTKILNADVFQVSHHGSFNGTDDATVNAVTPKIALLGTGPSNLRGEYTAYAFGHPNWKAIKPLLAGMGETRPPILEPIGNGAYSFTSRTIDKAIYATGWDGDIVVTADKDANYTIALNRSPTPKQGRGHLCIGADPPGGRRKRPVVTGTRASCGLPVLPPQRLATAERRLGADDERAYPR